MSNRSIEFAKLCNNYGLSIAVELGVHQAVFAKGFYENWTVQDKELYLIDSYNNANSPFFPRVDTSTKSPLENFAVARRQMELCPSCTFIIATGKLASKIFSRLSPQFVYIDACHVYESVIDDITTWYPLIQEGGILAGHDYDSHHAGVRKAVDEFVADNPHLTLNLIQDDNTQTPSWFVIKPRND